MRKVVLLILLHVAHLTFSQPLYQTEPTARVRILNNTDTLKILFNDDWLLTSENASKQFIPTDGEVVFTIENDKIKIADSNGENIFSGDKFVLQSANEDALLTIKNVPFGVGWWWEGKEDRIYEGELHIYVIDENKFEVVVHLPIEQYLKGVVPYEIGPNSPLEALRAQAVAARSEAIIALNSKLYSGEHYDLTSDVECQVFSGNGRRNKQSDFAVELTKSLILSENGKPINAYYASNCGGHSELIKNVWGDRPAPESYSISQFDWEEQNETSEKLIDIG